MKLCLIADEANGVHTKFTVFMNGANCGQLCMTEEEAVFFHQVVMFSGWINETDEVFSKGCWINETEKWVDRWAKEDGDGS